jgi:cytochrome c
MFGFDLKKLAGAILTAGLAVVVIDFIGDVLVQPKKQKAATITATAKPPSPPKEVEKAIPVATLLATADVAAGRKSSSKCKSCHDLTAKKKVKIGPPLWDIVLAGKGSIGKFRYSPAMSGMGGKWSYEDLDAFLASPKGFMKGTKMTFAGIKNAKDRANLIVFLRSLSDAPKPLP